MITRIAPTPSGFLHKGNVFNFLLNWLWARANGGKVLLRIDDADAERKRKEYVEDIFRVLEALGIDWDMGPSGPQQLENEWSQCHRKDLYEAILHELEGKDILYACRCSRTIHTGKDDLCDCKRLHLSLNEKHHSCKIKVPSDCHIDISEKTTHKIGIEDFVVRKKDGEAAYAISSLADDLHFGVTHIVRGEDLLESTARQIYIDSLLPQPSFHQVRFRHHPLLRDENNTKYSKSAGAQSTSILNTERPETILKDFVNWMAWDENQFQTLGDLLNHSFFIKVL